jgi:Tol biopolymer transport system component
VGESQSTLWVHDSKGERQITFEGYAYLPSFSADTSRLYYLQRSTANRRFASGELWTVDLQTGKKQRLLADLMMENYSVSRDGKQVAFINADNPGRNLWIASTDGSSPARRLVNQECNRALFAPNGDIYFAGGGTEGMYLQKIKADGTGLEKVIQEKVYDISPDGKWIAVWSAAGTDVKFYRSDGSDPKLLCSHCASGGAEERGITPPIVSWSRDGKELYLYSEDLHHIDAVPLKPGEQLPPIPPSGISWRAAAPQIAGVRTIPQRAFMNDPQMYAYLQVTAHRNIYRVPVP